MAAGAAVDALDGAPEDEQERLVVDLLLGHGWRGVELRRLTAANVRSAREGEIWIWGKERKEFGPLLNETRDLLLRLAQGLSDDEPVLRARRTQYGVHQPLGDDGLRRWVEDLCRRAGLTEYKPHDMRRTFGTLVARHSGDSHLVERLQHHFHIRPVRGGSARSRWLQSADSARTGPDARFYQRSPGSQRSQNAHHHGLGEC